LRRDCCTPEAKVEDRHALIVLVGRQSEIIEHTIR
jgi:hypothetical protein